MRLRFHGDKLRCGAFPVGDLDRNRHGYRARAGPARCMECYRAYTGCAAVAHRRAQATVDDTVACYLRTKAADFSMSSRVFSLMKTSSSAKRASACASTVTFSPSVARLSTMTRCSPLTLHSP